MMKKVSIMSLMFVGLMLMACDEIDDLLTFRMHHTVTMEIPASSPLNLPIEIPTPDVSTNSSQTFENNNTNASLVKDVKLESLELTVSNPAGKTFNFLKSIIIYISTDELEETELASLDEIPQNATTITLSTTSQRLDEYAKSESYRLRTSIVTKEALTQSVDIDADITFKVTAKPL